MKRRMEILQRMMKTDPEGTRDSLRKASLLAKKEKAKQRIEEYQHHLNISEVTKIDLSNGDFTTVPEFVFKAVKLEELILDDNEISRLPRELKNLSNLKMIRWSHNELSTKRIKIPKLTGIETFHLYGNKLSKLPNLKRLKNVKKLYIGGNKFPTIPVKRLRKLKNLHELSLARNPLVLGKEKYSKLSGLKKLGLIFCEIDSVHPSFYQLHGLTELVLAENKLTHLSDGISGLSSLVNLSLYKNKLEDLPSDIGELKKLEEIDLYYNNLEVIPPAVGDLDNLKVLYLSYNKIYDLPEEIGNLSNLRELYVHHNRLSFIPEGISRLNQLKVLHFQENFMPEFPYQILGMKSIRDLDISFTEIRVLPLGIEKMELENFYYKDLDIDLLHSDNDEARAMIMRMLDRGTNCNPRIYEEGAE